MNKLFKSGLVYYSNIDTFFAICGMGLCTLSSGIVASKCFGLILGNSILAAAKMLGLDSLSEILSNELNKFGWEETSLNYSILYNFLWFIPYFCVAIISGFCTFKLNKGGYNGIVILCCALVMGVSSILLFLSEVKPLLYILGLIHGYISLKSIHLVLKLIYRE